MALQGSWILLWVTGHSIVLLFHILHWLPVLFQFTEDPPSNTI